MNVLLNVLLSCVAFYFIDRICLWLEERGWLYYRCRKPEGGVIGNALLELQSFLNPGTRNTIEMKQGIATFKKSDSDSARDILK